MQLQLNLDKTPGVHWPSGLQSHQGAGNYSMLACLQNRFENTRSHLVGMRTAMPPSTASMVIALVTTCVQCRHSKWRGLTIICRACIETTALLLLLLQLGSPQLQCPFHGCPTVRWVFPYKKTQMSLHLFVIFADPTAIYLALRN